MPQSSSVVTPSRMNAREVKKIRLARGETQLAFAALLGVAETTVWRWENAWSPVSHPFPVLIRTLAAQEPPEEKA